MSHILALQVDHFSMQNLDQFSVQLNNRSAKGTGREFLAFRAMTGQGCQGLFGRDVSDVAALARSLHRQVGVDYGYRFTLMGSGR
jgi:hypothetical protein